MEVEAAGRWGNRGAGGPEVASLPLTFAPTTDDLRLVEPGGGPVEVRTWGGRVDQIDHDGRGSSFVVALEPAGAHLAHGSHPLPARSYAVLTDPARVEGGTGLMVTHRSHAGLPLIGGPVEATGRLGYIDGCRDTLLVAPVRRGDPCLNLLHVPPDTRQSDHDHPSVRVGVVLAGAGRCVLDDTVAEAMVPGVVFILPPGATHRFETSSHDLLVVAWHPDSDFGPTDHDHPMLNATLRPGTAHRFR